MICVPFCVESELSGVRQQVLTSTFLTFVPSLSWQTAAFSIRKRSLGTDGTVLDSHASSSRSTLLTPCYVYTPGIEQVGPRSYLWYKRTVTIPPGCGKRNFEICSCENRPSVAKTGLGETSGKETKNRRRFLPAGPCQPSVAFCISAPWTGKPWCGKQPLITRCLSTLNPNHLPSDRLGTNTKKVPARPKPGC
jgi:hypothetical protein